MPLFSIPFPLRPCVAACALALLATPAFAQELSDLDPGEDPATVEPDNPKTGGKLLLTAGVTQVEGAAGGGLTPWATIGAYGDRGQIGANAFYTRVDVDDYGQAVVIGDGNVPPELVERARLAVANCPEFAITITE